MIASLCTLQDGYTVNQVVEKYEWEVKAGTKYYFYILSHSDGSNNYLYDNLVGSWRGYRR